MKKIISLVIVSTLFLVSCNTVRDSAGINRKVIDEYAVIEKPPLVIPPDFNLLPPDQIKSKNIDNADTELAKEILFGLDNNENEIKEDNSLIKEIIKETQATEIDKNIRDTINQDFAGEKSSINDETKFMSEDELNKAIQETANKDKNKKEKKKKRFFFF
tara:strand:+ start:359 stop:838 length:480 start_codon:yes stop_codon:yes gene_type:complete